LTVGADQNANREAADAATEAEEATPPLLGLIEGT